MQLIYLFICHFGDCIENRNIVACEHVLKTMLGRKKFAALNSAIHHVHYTPILFSGDCKFHIKINNEEAIMKSVGRVL